MQTKHYIVNNISAFIDQTEAVKKLEEYLNCIEEVAFPAIEEVFGETWNDDRINIELNNKTGGAEHYRSGDFHFVNMGINNKNIKKEYPENLWGCLFHETHHAFFNPIIHNKENREIFNGGHKAEVFNYAFMATTYLKLKEKNEIDASVYEHFVSRLKWELNGLNRKYRASREEERELSDNAMDIFQEYIKMFSVDIENFPNFIAYVKSNDSVFTSVSNFRQDLDTAKEFLGIPNNLDFVP